MALETFEKLPAEKKNLILSTGIRAFSRTSYNDVSTNSITNACQISKGLLFHYFGSKKDYYLYCLETALARLTAQTEAVTGADFYEILFAAMNQKLALCMQCPEETHLVNMASRDASAEIASEKADMLRKYALRTQLESAKTLQAATESLPFKEGMNTPKTQEALHIYIRALLNRYLLRYQQTPDQFFENSRQIQQELKESLNLMLYGICKEEDL